MTEAHSPVHATGLTPNIIVEVRPQRYCDLQVPCNKRGANNAFARCGRQVMPSADDNTS